MSSRKHFDLFQWLSWMETLHPTEIELGLSRIRTVADRLNISSNGVKVITVAGTNGKGSCIYTLEKLLQAKGKKVGAYTSPHILNYNERIRIQGVDIDDASLCRAFCDIDQARGDISLTYFEFGTLAALLIFQWQQLDYWLLEVGLGGRLDAVNIIDPDVAVITSIDLDHQAWLGETRDEIAREKLGILREDIVCVCAEPDLTESMITLFREKNVRLRQWGKDFFAEPALEELLGNITSRGEVQSFKASIPNLPMPSVMAALQCVEECEGGTVEDIDGFMSELQLSGRFESYVFKGSRIIFDVAHNPAATTALANTLQQKNIVPEVAVVAMMGDKHIPEALAPITPVVERWVATGCEGVPRSASAKEMSDILRPLVSNDDGLLVCENVNQALAKVFAESAPTPHTVLVFGSFYTVGQAKTWLLKHSDDAPEA